MEPTKKQPAHEATSYPEQFLGEALNMIVMYASSMNVSSKSIVSGLISIAISYAKHCGCESEEDIHDIVRELWPRLHGRGDQAMARPVETFHVEPDLKDLLDELDADRGMPRASRGAGKPKKGSDS